MAELSEAELKQKVIDTLKEGDDPKSFVLAWCKPSCTDYDDMVKRCESALKIIRTADPEKTCLFRFRQWVECVENCTQPKSSMSCIVRTIGGNLTASLMLCGL